MIAAQNLEVTFNKGTPRAMTALRQVSLDIPPGDFVTVIGTNGAGKSTLLNALAGDVRVDTGSISFDGKIVTNLPAFRRASLVSRVFQDPVAGTCEALTVEENLAVALRRGRSLSLRAGLNRETREMFRERLAAVGLGLEKRLQDRVSLLSGGQRQVICLIMASLTPTRLLLLDEHTAALDPRTARLVLSLTDRVIESDGLTAIMVTHSMRQALDHGNRTLMMHEGRIVLDISGDERRGLTVLDLLAMFENVRGEELADDALLLG
jgi:putative tryptophan/tyrosine transport system ATP-binding protein